MTGKQLSRKLFYKDCIWLAKAWFNFNDERVATKLRNGWPTTCLLSTAQTVTKIISYKVYKFWPVWSSTKHICNDTIMEIWCHSRERECHGNPQHPSLLRLCSQGNRGLGRMALCSWHRHYYRPTGRSLAVQVITPIGRRHLGWGTHTTKQWAKENIMKRYQRRQRTLKSWNHSDWLVTDWLLNSPALNSLTTPGGSAGLHLHVGQATVIHLWRGRLLPERHRTDL